MFPEPLRKVDVLQHTPSRRQSAPGLKSILRLECGQNFTDFLYLQDSDFAERFCIV